MLPFEERRPTPDPTTLTTQQLTMAVAAQRDLFETRLDVVNVRFSERLASIDKIFAERSTAVSKADVATGDAIKQLEALFQTAIGGLTTQVNDLKSRLDKGEGSGLGHKGAVDDYRYERKDHREVERENRGVVFGVTGIVISVSATIVAIFGHFMSK